MPTPGLVHTVVGTAAKAPAVTQAGALLYGEKKMGSPMRATKFQGVVVIGK